MALVVSGCSKNTTEGFHVGIFVPGFIEGSPTYEMMASGAKQAAEINPELTIRIVEGGMNQAEWEGSLMSMAGSQEFDVIVTSNPAMPEVARRVLEEFPHQHFIMLDANGGNNPSIYAISFDHQEQAFLNGFAAGMISASNMENTRPGVRVGLIAGQEYPVMNDRIKRGFILGARTANPMAQLDFRVVGNWNDPGKAAELATSMIDAQTDIILTICGGGNQGVITAARENGAYVSWFDSPAYEYAPGIIVSSTYVRQDLAARESILAAAQGTLQYGQTVVLGISDGYIGFASNHSGFTEYVPEGIQSAIVELENRIQSGEQDIPGTIE